MKKADELLKEIDKKINNWNERSQFTIKGVKNLSKSDLDTLVLYAKQGTQGLMTPRGSVAEVLKKYDLIS